MRVGKNRLIGKFRARIGIGFSCRLCRTKSETVFHVFNECCDPGLVSLRKKYSVGPYCLRDIDTNNPRKAVVFFRAALDLLTLEQQELWVLSDLVLLTSYAFCSYYLLSYY